MNDLDAAADRESQFAVVATNLTKTYHRGDSEVRALDGLSVSIAKGELTAVIGPSGSGKSTLLHVVGLLDRPGAGEVWLWGRRTAELGSGRRARMRAHSIGFVFQSFHLLPRLSAVRNVTLPLLYGGESRRRARARAEEALALVGLAARADHYPSELSGGESQRVAIARAIVTRPAVILADEPTGNLDRQTGSEILDLFARINEERGATVVMVTHDPEVASRCSRRIHLRDGRVESER